MPTIRKVALVSHERAAYFHRLMLGALSFTEVESKIATRDFRLPENFSDLSEAEAAEVVNPLRSWNPDGLLCALGSESLEMLIRLFPEALPTVNMVAARPMPGMTVVAGSQPAMFSISLQHLMQLGFKSVAYLDLEEPPLHEIRRALFKQIAQPSDLAMASYFELLNPDLLANPYAPVKPVPDGLSAWLRRLPKPVGILCTTTGGGGYLIRVCHELGLRVPEDVAVVGGDDTDLALASDPPLTTVLPAGLRIGAAAMQMLDQKMKGEPTPAGPVRIAEMDLHVRKSTGLEPNGKCNIAAAQAYIRQHACQGLGVERLIKETQQVSKATFYSHFLAATGQTPAKAIEQRQVEEARRLLADSGVSMTSIAEYCGFSDSSNFARTFRSIQGMTPRDYRKQEQAKKAGTK